MKGFKKHENSSKRSRAHKIKKHKKKYGSILNTKKITKAISYKTSEFYGKMGKTPSPITTKNGYAVIKVPSNFCLITAPEKSLEFIHKASQYANNLDVSHVHLDHSGVQNYNLAAESLLGLGIESSAKIRGKIRRNYKNLNLQRTCHLKVTGKLPKNSDHRKMIEEIGVLNDLKSISRNSPKSNNKLLFRRKSVGANIADAYSNDDKTKAAVQFSNHVNRCINEHQLSLTQEAKTDLMRAVSEVLDNAERHSSTKGNSHIWHARGYLNSKSEKEFLEISLFNFGMTIAETFETLPEGNYGKRQAMDYVTHHKGGFNSELLITIAALQQRYSSKNTSDMDTYGQGTIILIEFFEQFCDDLSKTAMYKAVKPQMSILSGKTHIVFDGTYRLTNHPNYTDTDDEQLIIAFNEANSLKYAPDPNYVRQLSGNAFFPGVCISIKIPLKEESDDGENSDH